jgi:AraC-like DNA-binding protein
MIISVNQHFPVQKPRDRDQYKNYIAEYLSNHKPFLVPGFSLQDMSLQTGINVPTLSALINKEYGMNFNDFINKYRVNHFKSLVQQPHYQRWTLEAIANKAGFNSRTTFIRAFTKFEECAPSEYLKYLKTNYLVA